MPLLLEIVTPDKKVYSAEVDLVLMPTTEGEVGILPSHMPLLTQLAPGKLTISQNNKREHLAVDKGFVQVIGNKVSVLTEGAINIEEIDLSAVEDAQKRAEKALADAAAEDKDPAEIEQLERIVRFSLAQKLAKNKRR